MTSSQTTAIERPMAAAQLAMPTQQWRLETHHTAPRIVDREGS